MSDWVLGILALLAFTALYGFGRWYTDIRPLRRRR